MLLDLSRFRAGDEHLDRRIDPSVLAKDDDEFRIAGPVGLIADLHKDDQKVRLTGRVTATLGLDCSRCVEAFEIPVDARFDLLLLPLSANTGAQAREAEREVKEDDLGVSYYQDDVIDLGEVVREQLYLALPMKPLCRDDCRGLCPVCGTNKNREQCGCQAEWVDPRLEPLRKLRGNS
jgi:uncharacterized protein